MTSTAEPTSPLAIETNLRGVVRLLGLSAVLPRMGEYRQLATTTTDASRLPWTSSEGRRLTPRKRHLSATTYGPSPNLPSKRRRDLILRVWHVDPLRYPVCQSPMHCVIAVIDEPKVTEKILRHLGAWHDPHAGVSPPGAPRPCTHEPCDEVDPMPDHENVLTD